MFCSIATEDELEGASLLILRIVQTTGNSDGRPIQYLITVRISAGSLSVAWSALLCTEKLIQKMAASSTVKNTDGDTVIGQPWRHRLCWRRGLVSRRIREQRETRERDVTGTRSESSRVESVESSRVESSESVSQS
jgi:hypothetical protein